MLVVVVVLQVLVLLLAAVLLTRKAPAPVADERLQRLPETVSALAGRLEATDAALRTGIVELRREHAEANGAARHAAETANRSLREEVSSSIGIQGRTIKDDLAAFRADNATAAEALRSAVQAELQKIDARLNRFTTDAALQDAAARESLHGKLNELSAKNQGSHDALREAVQGKLAELGQQQAAHQEKLRDSVDSRLKDLAAANEKKLEEMRATVDEKLNATLNDRLTASFGQVSTHLGEVQKGLGEMREFANGVSDLKRVFSNVKSRGVIGEFQLSLQLEQMFSREQYEKNVEVRQGSGERVEYALKVPQGTGSALFPIDSKFPSEDWERLEKAYEEGAAEEIASAGKRFEAAIKAEAKKICEKYIAEPVTLPHAIMFLPTEGLYAEVMRRPGLQSEIQQNCSVTIAGPSTLMAILTSFRMGFHTLAMERKGHEIEKVLGKVKGEFGKFGDLLGKAEKQVQTVQNTLGDIRGKTTTITRSLRDVTELSTGDTNETEHALEDLVSSAPLLAGAGRANGA